MPTRGSPAASSCASGCWREPVDQRRHVARLRVGRVDGDRAAGVAEPARVPRQHVEAGLAQRADADVAGALVAGRVRVGLARAAPAVALEDRRRLAAARRGMEGEHDLRAVEGRDRGVAGLGGGGGDQERAARAKAKGAHGSGSYPPISRLRVVARERRGHAVLQRARRGGPDAVHQERERDALAARRVAEARERRDVAQRAGLGAAAVLGGGAAHAAVQRAVAADDGERLVERHGGLASRPCRSAAGRPRAASCGWRARARSRRRSRGAMPKRSTVSRTTAPPAAVRARAAELGAEALDQRLGDVVVRRLVHLAHDRGDGRRVPLATAASCRSARARRGPCR